MVKFYCHYCEKRVETPLKYTISALSWQLGRCPNCQAYQVLAPEKEKYKLPPKTKLCPKCKGKVSRNATICKFCGYKELIDKEYRKHIRERVFKIARVKFSKSRVKFSKFTKFLMWFAGLIIVSPIVILIIALFTL